MIAHFVQTGKGQMRKIFIIFVVLFMVAVSAIAAKKPLLKHHHQISHVGKLGPGKLSGSPYRSGITRYGKRFYRRGPINVVMYPGSLKSNVERIASNNGWSRVVWMAKSDYRWYGKAQIVAYSLPGVFDKLLKDYPVQAQFYEGNHILAIVPRTIQ